MRERVVISIIRSPATAGPRLPLTNLNYVQESRLCYEGGLANQNGRQPNGQFQVSSKRLPSQETKRVLDMAPNLSLNAHHATGNQHNLVSYSYTP
jgi:hypothetical protein